MSGMFRFFAVVLVFLAAPVANAQPRLVFDHKIGVDWPVDSPRWMSFVAISSDAQTVTGDAIMRFGEGNLRFWSFPNGKLVRSIDGFPLAISPDFRYLVLQQQVLDLLSGKPLLTVAKKQDTLDVATFSADSALLAVKASPDLVKGSQLTILRTAGGSMVSSFGTRFICAMAFAPDGHTIATGHWNNITLWNVQTGQRLAVLMSPQRKVDPARYWRGGRYLGAVAVSPDGKLIAAGSDDGELQIWNAATRELLHTSSLSWAAVSAVAFSPDSNLIATGSYHDGTLRLVDAATGKVLSEIQVSMFGVGSVAFSPDGRYLLVPSNAGMIDHGKYSRGGSIRVFRIEK